MADDTARADAADAEAEAEVDTAVGCRPPLWLILLAFGVVVLAVVIGLQVFGVLYGLLFPPDAPRPDDVVRLAHETIDTQVYEWRYETGLDPCALIAFYEAEGSTCSVVSGACQAGRYVPPLYEVDAFAHCEGVQTFSVFALRWRVTIEPVYRAAPEGSTFTLLSEVLWGGAPRPTSTPSP